MTDAKTLFREGVLAIRDEKDLQKGRKLLTESLRLNPKNEMAWLWLARTVSDADKQRQCLEQALQLNPDNEQAQALMKRLNAKPARTATPAPAHKKMPVAGAEAKIQLHLTRADECLREDDTEGAIEQWVHVLEIEADHEEALASAVRHLSRLKYIDDARELVWNAINSGTTHPSVYLTAIDIAKLQHHHQEADDLRVKLACLPDTDEKLIVEMIDHFRLRDQEQIAIKVAETAVAQHPTSQKLLVRLADLYDDLGYAQKAFEYFERAAQVSSRSKEGREADARLQAFAPMLKDNERGSIALALREALGFGVVYLLMAWQDAGLNLAQLGTGRWAGVGLSVLGGYLLVTATSSPQQQPLARWLGGVVPEPEEHDTQFDAAVAGPSYITQIPAITLPVRAAFGLAGLLLLVLAFSLVFNVALGLLNNPNPAPFYLPTFEEVFGE